MVDAVALSGEITPVVTAAVAAYGAAVLTRVQDTTADATVSLGQRVLRRITGRPGEQPGVEDAVADLADDPDDPDAQAALRMQVRKALLADDALAEDIARLVAGAPGVTVTASGDRSVAAQTIHGNVSTGDTVHITPGAGRADGVNGAGPHPN
ncbi:hypothetical protein AQ490_13135 [Wenjunlia vitaminophila]|uniref:Uncharacterized protein n=1 Tax=Wenjunlia vitaminophila TaxID=76728 RepID=A0A0T6LXN4_WENVI|nr:hypothetical protein [Wenjunlia vitaminophila]KRV50891.1 hypothetical protein AQ490_13135 [Wenjunlia vitaminophila]